MIDQRSPEYRRKLSAGEVVVGAALTGLAALSWMALLDLDVHAGTFPLIVATTGGCLAVIAVLARVAGGRFPGVRLDAWGLAGLAVVSGFAAFMFFPGFGYGATDKDPGGYVEIGAAFARYHSYSFPDLLGRRVPGVVTQTPGARFPALFVRSPGLIVPQFYHLWPALLAVANDLDGLRWEVGTTPLVGVIAVGTFTVLLRRVLPGRSGAVAATIGGLLLAGNVAEVWQAKYPTAEMLEQALLLAMLLAVVITLETGWAPAAGLGGLFLGVAWLARADIILPIVILIAIGGALYALGRFDRRCAWFLAGFAVTAPHGLWQAYGSQVGYTLSNGVPPLTAIAAGTAAVLIAALALRRVSPATLDRLSTGLERRRLQRQIGAVVLLLAALALTAGAVRVGTLPVSDGSTNVQTIRWLLWLVSAPAIAVGFAGLAVVALRRWRAKLWVAASPALLLAPVYIANLHDDLPLMPGVRRLVPAVIPGLLILVTIALGAALRASGRGRLRVVASALGAAALFGDFLSQSVALRGHDEDGGSFRVTAQVAATAGRDTGVYLWQFPQPACCTTPEYLFGGALWLERGQYSALLPAPTSQDAHYVRTVRTALAGHPVFIVWNGSAPPPIPGVRVRVAARIKARLRIWNESYTELPTGESAGVRLDFTVWRVLAGRGRSAAR
jgi:hypothetical protein